MNAEWRLFAAVGDNASRSEILYVVFTIARGLFIGMINKYLQLALLYLKYYFQAEEDIESDSNVPRSMVLNYSLPAISSPLRSDTAL